MSQRAIIVCTCLMACVVCTRIGLVTPHQRQATGQRRASIIAGHRVLKVLNADNSWMHASIFYPAVIFEDKAGRYWVGSDSDVGLLQMYDERTQQWWAYGRQERDERNILHFIGGAIIPTDVRRVAQSRDGKLWFCSAWAENMGDPNGAYVSTFDGKRWEKFEIKHDRPGTNCIGFCRDRDGVLWFWNKDELSSYDGQHWSPTLNVTELLKAVAARQPDRLLAHERRAGRPYDILEAISARDGCLWLATLHGVVRFDPRKGEWTPYPDIGPYSTDYLYEDHAGRIWIGDTGSKKEVQVYDKSRGVVARYALGEHIPWAGEVEEITSLVHAIYQDRQGRMLFAVGRWLLSFSEATGKWEAFSAETIGMTYLNINGEVLPAGEIMNIMEDSQGRIWITGRSGIAVLE